MYFVWRATAKWSLGSAYGLQFTSGARRVVALDAAVFLEEPERLQLLVHVFALHDSSANVTRGDVALAEERLFEPRAEHVQAQRVRLADMQQLLVEVPDLRVH